MPHFKSFFDRDYLYAFELAGKDCTVTISRVTAGELTALGGRKSKKPLCYFKESKSGKPLALNATNCRVIAALFGPDTDDWIGRQITLYPTETQMAGETVQCIRVRPQVPPPKTTNTTPAQPEPSDNDGENVT